MKGITGIRWHARAGQGAVSAAKILADTAMAAGDYVQAFPEYGPEREGAPLRAYNRIGKRRFSIYCEIEHPGVIVVMDPTLLDTVNVVEGATPETVFLNNSPKCPADLKEAHPQLKPFRVATVDATNISLEHLMTLGGRHVLSEGLRICGARNVFERLAPIAPQVSVEAVLAVDPQMIVTAEPGGIDRGALQMWKRFPEQRAVAGGHLVTIDADRINRHTPRLAAELAVLCERIDTVRQAMAAARSRP